MSGSATAFTVLVCSSKVFLRVPSRSRTDEDVLHHVRRQIGEQRRRIGGARHQTHDAKKVEATPPSFRPGGARGAVTRRECVHADAAQLGSAKPSRAPEISLSIGFHHTTQPHAQPSRGSRNCAAALSATAPPSTMRYLVADTGPIIKGHRLDQLGATGGVTLPEVVDEVRDERARQLLATMDVQFREPSDESIAAVRAFAKLTGDLPVLSGRRPGTEAGTWMLEKECRGVAHLRTEPPPRGAPPRGAAAAANDVDMAGEGGVDAITAAAADVEMAADGDADADGRGRRGGGGARRRAAPRRPTGCTSGRSTRRPTSAPSASAASRTSSPPPPSSLSRGRRSSRGSTSPCATTRPRTSRRTLTSAPTSSTARARAAAASSSTASPAPRARSPSCAPT